MDKNPVIVNASEALKLLKKGNNNFITMDLEHPNFIKERLAEIKNGQFPYAAFLSCSDSRVPLELIFDAGLGDVFVVRNAGNVLSDHVIGSLEYAVTQLGVRLIVILGHDECGAVKATLGEKSQSKFIDTFMADIKPALELAKTQAGDLLENTIINNVVLSVKELIRRDDVLAEFVKKHGLMIIPAKYCFNTGRVDFYEDKAVGQAVG